MTPQFIWPELSTSRVLVVVTVDLGVTLEADGNGIVDIVGASLCLGNNMISLHLDAAEAMADATSAVAVCQEFGNLFR